MPVYTQGQPDLSAYAKTADLAATAAAMQALIPPLASSPPPAVALASAVGSSTTTARADHTHLSSVQAVRVTLTLNASGIGTWTYPNAFGAGVVPVIETTAETPSGATYTLDAKLIAGSVTNTSCQIIVNRINASATLAGTALALLGQVLAIVSPATGTAVVHCWARAPS